MAKKSIILTVFLLAVGLLLKEFPIALSMQSEAEIGGFLYPWDGVKRITNQNPHEGQAIDIVTITNPREEFAILAPKDGIIIDFFDGFPVTLSSCDEYDSRTHFTNYIVLGHGPQVNGKYHSYTLYYHLKQGSVEAAGISKYMRVRLGQVIGTAGNTGKSSNNHLHFVMSKDLPLKSSQRDYSCNGVTLENSTYRYIPSHKSIAVGFEEQANTWPIEDGTTNVNLDSPASFNHESIQQEVCNTETAAVILYNHVDYGGECHVVPPGIIFSTNIPDGMHVSSIFVNPDWVDSGNWLTLYSLPNGQGYFTRVAESIADIREYTGLFENNWHDTNGSVKTTNEGFSFWHIGGFTSVWQSPEEEFPDWLEVLSLSENLPLDIEIHTKVDASNPDVYDSHRVLVDGNEIFQTSASEFYFDWNTYGLDDGFHSITVEYLLDSHNGNWNEALVYDEIELYLSANRGPYAPCGQVLNGATLTSNGDCIGITEDVGDLMPVHWENRQDLQVCAIGDVSVWAYDGVLDNWGNYNGIPKVIDSGQCKNVGDNVSSVDIQESGGVVGLLPDTPFVTDSDTVVHYRFDNNSIDETGNYSGSIAGSASYVTGAFGTALNAPNPPDGSGVVASAFDLSSFTLDLWLARPVGSTGGRVVCQLGGGGNTGQNKWCLHLSGNRPELEIWSAGGSQKLQAPYSLPDDGSWHYVNVSYDGNGSAVMYVDNVYAGTLTTAGVMNAGATTFEVGLGEGIYSCNCQIDELRLRSGVHPPEISSTATPTPEPTSTPIPTSTSIPDFDCGSVPFSGVGVFEDKYCKGSYLQLAPGFYNLTDLNFNDLTSAVHVPPGTCVEVYEHIDGAGQSSILQWDYWDFSLDTWPSGIGMNDTISSIEVYDNGDCTPPAPTETPTSTPTSNPSNGIELLSEPLVLSAESEADEQSVNQYDPEVLVGKDTVRITYDLHGLCALGGDASAFVFNQAEWMYVSLSDYGTNCMDGIQTVDVPLLDFWNHAKTVQMQPDTTIAGIRARFWYSSPYFVEILSAVAMEDNPTSPTATPTPTPTALPMNDFVIINSTLLGYEAIYKAEPDGTNWLKLAGDGSGSWKHAGYPRISPDGQWVAYEAHNGSRYLWIVGINGNNKQQLFSSSIHHARIVWAPDSSKIFFIGEDNIARTVEPDGSNLTVVPGWPTYYKPTSWCSDGKILAHYYVSNSSDNNIYSLYPDGSEITQLTYDSANDTQGIWSPDCSKIAFQSNRTGQYEIWVMNVDGANQTQLTFTANGDWSIYPVWSPGGNQILFSSSRDSSGYWDLFTMNSDGSNVTNITNTSEAEQWSDWGQ